MKTQTQLLLACVAACCVAGTATAAIDLPIEPRRAPVAQISATPAAPKFVAQVSDGTVRGVLNRWAHLNGMQEAVWHLGSDDIPVDREVAFFGDFESSVRDLMATTTYTRLPARACLHSNGVLRVIPRSRFCSQP